MSKFTHLSQRQQTLLKDFTEKIVQTVSPVKVLCYGTRQTVVQEWTPFTVENSSISQRATVNYDLLIVTQNDEKRPEHEIIQTVEQQATPFDLKVTSVVLKLVNFDKSLTEGWRFHTTAYTKGYMLYDGAPNILYAWESLPDMRGVINDMKQYWQHHFSLAQGFLKTAEYNLSQNWFGGVVFQLHQATHQVCLALLRVFTGYKAATPNLSRLFELTKNFSLAPATIFPCNTPEEKELFTILNRSFGEARHRGECDVPPDKVQILLRRVQELLKTAETLYDNFLQEVILHAPITFPLIGEC
ncbi:HEPN domain-containing protein [Filimonas zeae]|uniref:HEPN domain-containing protein n=1 Tax=Filimonas zeae TaxID=1737353 RepID=A0A917MYE7_9BACT|nr:HEPN domain-containing protein [Filimonas zeae]MDR6339888.1 HEPN domain-containing protein [Filimonas zeae]GGH70150.1 hypothetical protein GCM10011379_28130 [Filimonas zeae]